MILFYTSSLKFVWISVAQLLSRSMSAIFSILPGISQICIFLWNKVQNHAHLQLDVASLLLSSLRPGD